MRCEWPSVGPSENEKIAMQRRNEQHTTWLRRWTGTHDAAVLFDSDRDEFTGRGFFAAVVARPNVAVVAFTTDGDVFGGFYSVPVMEENTAFPDASICAFSFESHGRCVTPKRFVVKKAKKNKARVVVSTTYPEGFVSFHVGMSSFSIGNERSGSFCWSLSKAFETMQDTTLTGKRGVHAWHRCVRVIAVQLH